jgi:hypothetical protein
VIECFGVLIDVLKDQVVAKYRFALIQKTKKEVPQTLVKILGPLATYTNGSHPNKADTLSRFPLLECQHYMLQGKALSALLKVGLCV